MRFGLSLPIQHPVGDHLPHRVAEAVEMVRLARQAGEMTLGTGIMLLALQHPVDVAESIATIEQIAEHEKRLGIQQMGFRLHWPGMPHRRVMQAIDMLGQHVLPHFRTPGWSQR